MAYEQENVAEDFLVGFWFVRENSVEAESKRFAHNHSSLSIAAQNMCAASQT